MTITVIGHGYVGLVTASVFADFGNKVNVIGRTPEKIERLKKGDPIIFEPGLKELIEKNIKAKRLNFSLEYSRSVRDSDIVFIAVGTPPTKEGEADLSQVLAVAEKIGLHLKSGYTVISCKSTVPVGTNEKIKKIIEKVKKPKAIFDVVSCPEFLREGTGISDTISPDRVVIGSESRRATKLMLELHEPINGQRVVTDLASAELIKYASNSILAIKISFANLISFYSEKTGADVENVLSAVGLDKRIGMKFLNPGIGYGGACFPKDVQALIHTGHEIGVQANLLEAAQSINRQAYLNFTNNVTGSFKGKDIGIWGLSFKPNTDDIREAPSLRIIEILLDKGYEITAYDPEASEHVKKIFGKKIRFVGSPFDAAKNAEALLILTEWNEFKQINLSSLKESMKTPIIFDGRNMYSPEKMAKLGFEYHSVGRKVVFPR